MWRNNNWGFGMYHISFVVIHIYFVVLHHKKFMTNLPISLLDHNFVDQMCKKYLEKPWSHRSDCQNLEKPFDAIGFFRSNHTCLSLLGLWSSIAGGRTLSGSLAKVCLGCNVFHLSNMIIQISIFNKMSVQIALSEPSFKRKKLDYHNRSGNAMLQNTCHFFLQNKTPLQTAHHWFRRSAKKELVVAKQSNCEPNCVYICMQVGWKLKPQPTHGLRLIFLTFSKLTVCAQ